EDGIRDFHVTGVQTCALPIYLYVLPRWRDDERFDPLQRSLSCKALTPSCGIDKAAAAPSPHPAILQIVDVLQAGFACFAHALLYLFGLHWRVPVIAARQARILLRVLSLLCLKDLSLPTQPLLESAYGIDAERLRAIFADLVLSFLKPSWEASGKARVAEKTPF